VARIPSRKVIPHELRNGIPLVRVAPLLRYVRYLESIGAPVGRLLACSRIPPHLLDHPAAVIPLESAFRFSDLACRMVGTEHLGLYVGLTSVLDDLGHYGRVLQRAVTVHEYLCKGIALYNVLMTGQRLWLSGGEKEYRLNISSIGKPRLAAYQSQIETLAVTIAKLRKAAGPDWSPIELSLAYRTREDLPRVDLFAESRVLRGTANTYFTFPRSMVRLRFPGGGCAVPTEASGSPAECPLPQDVAGLIRVQVEILLGDRTFDVDTIAETLGMSRRSLQRALAREGASYSQVLTEARVHRAADWLETTDKPIAEIAFDLGYTDASNFTRAFRRQTGLPPQTFRDKAKEP